MSDSGQFYGNVCALPTFTPERRRQEGIAVAVVAVAVALWAAFSGVSASRQGVVASVAAPPPSLVSGGLEGFRGTELDGVGARATDPTGGGLSEAERCGEKYGENQRMSLLRPARVESHRELGGDNRLVARAMKWIARSRDGEVLAELQRVKRKCLLAERGAIEKQTGSWRAAVWRG